MILTLILLFSIVVRSMSQQMEPPTCNNCCQGPIGPQGPPGIPGVPGSHGSNGIPGGIGQKGEAGIGIRGEGGQRGDPGVRGEPGVKGERGEIGERGLPGKVGPSGPRGPIGLGEPGLRGLPGLQGERGVPGQAAVTRRSAFTAIKTSAQAGGNSNDIVTFQLLITNVGNDFDVSTGKFTCRVPGVYFFMFSLNTDNSPSDNEVFIVKNNGMLVGAANDKQTRDDHISTGTVVSLAVGDQVWLKFNAYDNQEIDTHRNGLSSFTGYLMYED